MSKPGNRFMAIDFASMAISAVLVRIVSLATNFVVAGVLGPADFGVLKIISFVPTITKFGGFGFTAVVMREVPHIRSQGSDGSDVTSRVKGVKSVAFTADIIWSLILAVGIAISALWFDKSEVRISLLIASATLMLRQFLQIYDGIATVDRRLRVVAASAVIGGIIQAVVTIALVWSLGIVGVLAGGLLGVLATVLWLMKSIDADFGIRFDFGELVRLGKMAIPLSMMTLATGLFAWAERIELLALYGAASFGVYVLSITAFQAAAELIHRLQKTLSVPLYEKLALVGDRADSESLEPAGKAITLITVALGVVLPFFGGGLWITGPYMVTEWLPKFVDVIPMLPWVAVMIGITAISSTVHNSMTSSQLGMRARAAGIMFAGAGVFIALTFVFKEMGLGVEYAAVSKAIAYAVVALLAFVYAGRRVFGSLKKSLLVLLMALIPMLLMLVSVLGLNQLLPDMNAITIAIQIFLFASSYIIISWVYLALIGYVDMRNIKSLKSFGTRV